MCYLLVSFRLQAHGAGPTYRFHVFRDTIVDMSLEVVAVRHPPVTTIAHDRVELPEVALRQELAQESPDRRHVDFPVNPIGLDDRAGRSRLRAVPLQSLHHVRSVRQCPVCHRACIGGGWYLVHEFQAMLMESFDAPL